MSDEREVIRMDKRDIIDSVNIIIPVNEYSNARSVELSLERNLIRFWASVIIVSAILSYAAFF